MSVWARDDKRKVQDEGEENVVLSLKVLVACGEDCERKVRLGEGRRDKM